MNRSHRLPYSILLALTLLTPIVACDGDGDGDDEGSSASADTSSSDADESSTGDTSSGDGDSSSSGDGDASSSGDGDSSSSGDGDGDACAGVTPEVTEITADELNTMLMNKDFEFINVHIPYAGQIAGTDAHIAYTDTDGLGTQLGGDLGRKAVLYCLTGPMSAMAAADLVALGYCNVYDMPAGMVGWQAEGYPVED